MGFAEFLGNERIVAALRGALRSQRVPHALLFAGPRGVGKFTLARMFAQSANCERLTDDFEVVGEAFAIGALGEHACESEFANATRAGEEQRVGDTLASEGTAERRDDAFVAEKFREAHWSAPFLLGGLREGE